MVQRESTDEFDRKPSLLFGFVAGVAGGLAGTAAKVIAERIYPPREPGEPPPHGELADTISEQVTGHKLDRHKREATGQSIHWVFGGLAGGVYGVAAEFWPRVTERNGAAFGLMLNFATHEALLPVIGLAPPPEEQSAQAHTSELATHALYGVAAEFVRKHTRAWMESSGRR